MSWANWRDRDDLLWSEDDFTIDPQTGCWLWHRRFSLWGPAAQPNAQRMHAIIPGSQHYNAARQIMEDYIGEPLPTDLWVVGECATNRGSFLKRCVNPEHHDLHGVQER